MEQIDLRHHFSRNTLYLMAGVALVLAGLLAWQRDLLFTIYLKDQLTTLGLVVNGAILMLFLLVVWWIGGAVVLVPLAAIPVLLLYGLYVQPMLRRAAEQGMRASALVKRLALSAPRLDQRPCSTQ